VPLAASPESDDAGGWIRLGRKELASGRIAQAQAAFERAVARAGREELPEALFLQAGVVRHGAEAEALYRRLLEVDPQGEYSARATLELAKILFAQGLYEGARDLLRDGGACAESEEACLFAGMASVMLHDYEGAAAALGRVRRGRAKTWAALSLAEAEEGAGRREEACRRYEALARARVSPVAWYRHAECLERAGDAEGARREYGALLEEFAQTPEAVRAAEKLSMEATDATPVAIAPEADAPTGPGFTIQFGSFGDRANAIKLAARIKKTYPGVRIDSELVNYREVFRVRIGHYATREAAQAAGTKMARELDEPFTVMPVAPPHE
jgi:tetratricopeptide (TPR) repeat protein